MLWIVGFPDSSTSATTHRSRLCRLVRFMVLQRDWSDWDNVEKIEDEEDSEDAQTTAEMDATEVEMSNQVPTTEKGEATGEVRLENAGFRHSQEAWRTRGRTGLAW